MSAIITKNQTLMRISSRFTQETSQAIDKINAVISKAEDWPIRFPASHLGTIETVRHELIRKLKDEAGWVVTFEANGAYLGVLEGADTVILNYKA